MSATRVSSGNKTKVVVTTEQGVLWNYEVSEKFWSKAKTVQVEDWDKNKLLKTFDRSMLSSSVKLHCTLFEDMICIEDLKPKPLRLSGDIGNASNQDLALLK